MERIVHVEWDREYGRGWGIWKDMENMEWNMERRTVKREYGGENKKGGLWKWEGGKWRGNVK
jgi:hypothetical protein